MNHNLKPILFGIVSALLMFVLAGHIKKVNYVNKSIAFKNHERITTSDKVSLPQKPKEPVKVVSDPSFDTLIDSVSSKKGTYSIYIHNLTTDEVFTHNPGEVYYGASLYKLPIAIAVLHEIYASNLTEDTLITYTQEDFSVGSGTIPRDQYGTEYKVSDLVSRLLKDSDNSAQLMLTRSVPKATLDQAFAIVTPENNQKLYVLNEGTAQDYAYVYDYLFQTALNRNDDKFIGQKNALYILSQMKNTSFEDRISTGLTTSDFSHKIGNWGDTGSWHDCGLAYTSDLHIVCMMSKYAVYEDVVEVGKLIGEFIEN